MKRLLLLSKIIISGTLLFLFVDGANKMFFHQDDIIMLWDMVANSPNNLFSTASGHLIFFFKPIFFLEWYIFRLNFIGYLAVSMLLHTLAILTVARIVFRLTGDRYWRMISLLMLAVNVNFYEVLWMPSSQMMSLSALFSLLSLLVTLSMFEKSKADLKSSLSLFLLAIIPGLNWGTGLFIPFCLLAAFGWKITKNRFVFTQVSLPLFLSQVALIVIFIISPRSYAGGATSAHPFQVTDIFEMLKFVFFGISYSIVGRYLFPLASRLFRFLTVGSFLVWIAFFCPFKTLKKMVVSNWRVLLLCLVVLFGSYFLIALARYQFGLGQAGAPRYAYLPMMFVVIAITTTLARLGLSGKQKELLLIIVMLYTVLSLGAFAQVTVKWTERPQKNRILFSYLQDLSKGECLQNDFLPWYIVEVDQWTLKDLWPIFGKDFDPFTGEENCIKINRDIAVPWSPTESK